MMYISWIMLPTEFMKWRENVKTYPGNYTDFVIQKEAYLSGAVKAYEKEQEKFRKWKSLYEDIRRE